MRRPPGSQGEVDQQGNASNLGLHPMTVCQVAAVGNAVNADVWGSKLVSVKVKSNDKSILGLSDFIIYEKKLLLIMAQRTSIMPDEIIGRLRGATIGQFGAAEASSPLDEEQAGPTVEFHGKDALLTDPVLHNGAPRIQWRGSSLGFSTPYVTNSWHESRQFFMERQQEPWTNPYVQLTPGSPGSRIFPIHVS